MGSIKILKPGLLTTIQDKGRRGYQQYGMPVSGAMDSYSMELANIAVGNDRNEAVLELTMMGPTIEFEGDMIFSIAGADMSPLLNGQAIPMYSVVYAKEGDVLEFGSAKAGMRAYFSIGGGLNIAEVMGSKSTYLTAKLGGLQGRKLIVGDIIPVNMQKKAKLQHSRVIPKEMIAEYQSHKELRVIVGPESEAFTPKGIDTFFTTQYTLTQEMDRMGFRLKGEVIGHRAGADIISSGINLGSIQVPGHGQPIIMLADRQTTGGYTKIANVIGVDIPYLVQLKPGDTVSFKLVNVDEAQQLLRIREQKIQGLIDSFKNTSCHTQDYDRRFKVRVNNKVLEVYLKEI